MQALETIDIKDPEQVYTGTDLKGTRIIIIGLGNVGVLYGRHVQMIQILSAVEQVRQELFEEEACTTVMEFTMKSNIEPIRERICELVAEFNEHKALIELSKRISHYPKHMQCQPINYQAPIIRPGIVRRGKRQSYKQLISGP